MSRQGILFPSLWQLRRYCDHCCCIMVAFYNIFLRQDCLFCIILHVKGEMDKLMRELVSLFRLINSIAKKVLLRTRHGPSKENVFTLLTYFYMQNQPLKEPIILIIFAIPCSSISLISFCFLEGLPPESLITTFYIGYIPTGSRHTAQRHPKWYILSPFEFAYVLSYWKYIQHFCSLVF